MRPTDVGTLWRRFDHESKPEIRVILKADAQGTLQVAQCELLKLGGDMANLRIVRASVGDAVASDVFLAETTKASILGYGVSVHREAATKLQWSRSPWSNKRPCSL